MSKSKLFLFTLLIILISSPVFAQDVPAVELKGIIARGETFAAILGVFNNSGNFDVVWSEDGQILFQTNAEGVILAVDPTGNFVTVQYQNSIWLANISTGEEVLLRDYEEQPADFSVLFTSEGTFFVLSIYRAAGSSWERTLTHYALDARMLGEWDAPTGFDHVESWDIQGGYIYLQEQYYGGPLAVVDMISGQSSAVNPYQYDDPQTRLWEYREAIEGAEVRFSMCTIDPATSECIPESIVEEVRPMEYREVAYITNPVNIAGTQFYAGFGSYSQAAGGMPPSTFVIVRDGDRFEASGLANSPAERLFPFSDLPSYAVNSLGEVVLVWGNWATDYELYKFDVVTLYFQPNSEGVEFTSTLLPSYDQIIHAIYIQG